MKYSIYFIGDKKMEIFATNYDIVNDFVTFYLNITIGGVGKVNIASYKTDEVRKIIGDTSEFNIK